MREGKGEREREKNFFEARGKRKSREEKISQKVKIFSNWLI